ncbi:MAG: hypothetical protein ACTSP6_06820 [Promethearchaeota archaeon]
MRTSRAFRLIIRLFLLLLASSMSLVSFLGGYSALLILGNEDNIDLDVDIEGDPLLDPTDFEINIEFEINNQGYFDLEDLNIEMKLYLVYIRLNQTNAEKNTTQYVKIYEDDKSFKTIEAGKKKKNSITIEPADLLQVNFTDIALTADLTKDPVISFEAAEITIKAKYSLGLISFKVVIEDYELEG